MKKLFFSLGAMVLLLTTACKKQQDLATVSAGAEKDANLSASVQPTTVLNPTVFFLEGSNLYSLTNLTANWPVITKKGNVFGDYNFFNVEQNNGGWTYNVATDEILCMSGQRYQKLSTKGLATAKVKQYFSQEYDNVILSPKNDKIYYLKSSLGQICSANLDGTGEEVIYHKDFIWSMDIDFVKGKIYFTHGDQTQFVSVVDITGANEKVIDMINGKVNWGTIKVSPSTNELFITTKSFVPQQYKILSREMETLQNPAPWRKVAEINFNHSDANLSFDIFPAGKQIFYSLCDYTDGKFGSAIARVNMDGTNNKGIYLGHKVKNVIVALPKQ